MKGLKHSYDSRPYRVALWVGMQLTSTTIQRHWVTKLLTYGIRTNPEQRVYDVYVYTLQRLG